MPVQWPDLTLFDILILESLTYYNYCYNYHYFYFASKIITLITLTVGVTFSITFGIFFFPHATYALYIRMWVEIIILILRDQTGHRSKMPIGVPCANRTLTVLMLIVVQSLRTKYARVGHWLNKNNSTVIIKQFDLMLGNNNGYSNSRREWTRQNKKVLLLMMIIINGLRKLQWLKHVGYTSTLAARSQWWQIRWKWWCRRNFGTFYRTATEIIHWQGKIRRRHSESGRSGDTIVEKKVVQGEVVTSK